MQAEEHDERDELDETIAEYTAQNPEFPSLFAAAKQRRALEREQRARRERLGLPAAGVTSRASEAYTPIVHTAEVPKLARDSRYLTADDGTQRKRGR